MLLCVCNREVHPAEDGVLSFIVVGKVVTLSVLVDVAEVRVGQSQAVAEEPEVEAGAPLLVHIVDCQPVNGGRDAHIARCDPVASRLCILIPEERSRLDHGWLVVAPCVIISISLVNIREGDVGHFILEEDESLASNDVGSISKVIDGRIGWSPVVGEHMVCRIEFAESAVSHLEVACYVVHVDCLRVF